MFENPLNEVLTFSEATALWELSDSTLRKTIGYSDRLKEGIDYRKSGKTWLIRKSTMERIYGKLENKK